MDSRLTRDLQSSIRTSSDRLDWARSLCRLASHEARQGLEGESAAAIEHVRNSFGNGLEPEVAAWLMLAEGIAHFVRGDFDLARDRIRRAHGIAVAMKAPRAQPSCAAWLAHLEFNLSNFPAMAPLLQEALLLAEPDDHQALARASLVMADGLHFSGSFLNARPWYDEARLHALKEGDDATVSALLHNVAAFRAANVRLAHALGSESNDEAQRARLEATSALSYDAAVGTQSFKSLSALVRGQLLLVEEKFDEATQVLSGIPIRTLPKRLRCVLLTDIAWCARGHEQHGIALENARSAMLEIDDEVDADDLAYMSARLSQLFRSFGDEALASRLAGEAKAAIDRHRSTQESLQAELLDVARIVIADSQRKKNSPA